MGYRNREKELKFVVKWSTGIRPVEKWVEANFSPTSTIRGDRTDLYWHPLSSKRHDFVRLRHMGGDLANLTLKHTDKGKYSDRVEKDVPIKGWEFAKSFALQIFGDPDGKIRKKYTVYILENDDTTISIYKVNGDNRVFLEVEARSSRRVLSIVNKLTKDMPQDSLEAVHTSLYGLFVAKRSKPGPKR